MNSYGVNAASMSVWTSRPCANTCIHRPLLRSLLLSLLLNLMVIAVQANKHTEMYDELDGFELELVGSRIQAPNWQLQ